MKKSKCGKEMSGFFLDHVGGQLGREAFAITSKPVGWTL